MKPKRCPMCKKMFQPFRSLQKCCGRECAHNYAVKKRLAEENAAAKADRKTVKIRLQEMKPTSYWWKRARRWFNAWVRARDEGKPCISCGKPLINTGKPGGDYDAGHFRSVGSAKHLEFDPRNVHGQCKYCNDALKGNPIGYERGLIERIGRAEVEALKADQDSRHLTADDYKRIEAESKQRMKELKVAVNEF